MSCGKDENKLYEAGIGSFKKVAMTEQSITTPDDPGLNPATSNFYKFGFAYFLLIKLQNKEKTPRISDKKYKSFGQWLRRSGSFSYQRSAAGIIIGNFFFNCLKNCNVKTKINKKRHGKIKNNQLWHKFY